MKTIVITVGKSSDKSVQELVDKYQSRMRNDMAIDWQFVPPAAGVSREKTIILEGDSIITKLKADDRVILLDERGEIIGNDTLSDKIFSMGGERGRLIFIIGGAFGVDSRIYERADFVWSLSKLVFPHQIVRLLLTEQLYRSLLIKQGHPYHHN